MHCSRLARTRRQQVRRGPAGHALSGEQGERHEAGSYNTIAPENLWFQQSPPYMAV